MERGSGSSKQALIVMARTGSALASRWTKVGDGTSCAAASSASWTGSRRRTRTVDEEDRRVHEPNARWRDAGACTAGRGCSRPIPARWLGRSIFRLEHGGRGRESMATTGGIILGRRTYEDFYSVWPKRTDNPYTHVLNNAQKYVASRTLKEPLPWVNSTLLKGDAAQGVARLKGQPGKDLVILGSGELVRSLMHGNLIDQYILLIHPLLLGSGQRLFPDDGSPQALRLVDSKATTTGVVIATYVPACPA